MPFCTKCGSQVGGADRFCVKCGTVQGEHPVEDAPAAAAPAAEPPPDSAPRPRPPLDIRLKPNVAALLCYIPSVGWVASVIFLASENYKRNAYVRFHAFQGLFLFVIYLVARAVFAPGFFYGPFPRHFPFSDFGFHSVLQLGVVAAQIVGIVKTSQNAEYRLPVLGELADKSMI